MEKSENVITEINQKCIEEICVRFGVMFSKYPDGVIFFDSKKDRNLIFHIAELELIATRPEGYIGRPTQRRGVMDGYDEIGYDGIKKVEDGDKKKVHKGLRALLSRIKGGK